MRVLNTRPREQAAELSRLLRSAGYDVVEAPAIATEPAWAPDAFAAARRDLARGLFAWVVLPSQNAGNALVRDLRMNSDRVLCGRATCEALGLSGATTLERFSARAALEVLRSRVHSGMRVLVPRAAEGRDELIDGLRELGADVFAPIAYRTVADDAAAERLRAGGIDLLTLCSPSAATAVAPALTRMSVDESALRRHAIAAAEAPDVLVVCLGQTTADAASALGLRVDAVAQQTSMASLVQAVASLTEARV